MRRRLALAIGMTLSLASGTGAQYVIADQGVFAPKVAYTGPCDVLITVTCAEAYSVTHAMTKNYNGPLFQLALIATPTSTLDVGQTAAHATDMTTWSAFCGGTQSNCFFKKIYAQIHPGTNDLAYITFSDVTPPGGSGTCATILCAATFEIDASTSLPILDFTSRIPEYALPSDGAATGVTGGTTPSTVMLVCNTPPATINTSMGGLFGMSHHYNAVPKDPGNSSHQLGIIYGQGGDNNCATATTWCGLGDYEAQGSVGGDYLHSKNIIMFSVAHPNTNDASYGVIGTINGVVAWAKPRQTAYITMIVGGASGTNCSDPHWSEADKDSHIEIVNGYANNDTLAQNQSSDGVWSGVRSTTSKSSGKWYFEVRPVIYALDFGWIVGLANSSAALATTDPGTTNNSVALQLGNGSAFQIRKNSVHTSYTHTIAEGDVWGIAVDRDNNLLWVNDWTQGTGWTNGTGGFTGKPAAGTNGNGYSIRSISGALFAAF